MTRVAMIGLGQMGGPMAERVVEAGFDTAVFDVSPRALARFSDTGVTIAESPADAALGADVTCIVVFDDSQVVDVLSGNDGVLSTMTPGSVVTIHSTVAPETIRTLAAAGSAAGIHVIDAGISGGETGAIAGTLLTMVGGSTEAVAAASPVLMSFSKEVVHAGDLGAGLALKLARNATGYICMTAVHEAMQLASAAGVSLEVLRHTIAETGVFDQALSPLLMGGPARLTPEDPESLRQLLTHLRSLGEKDLDQALALAAELDEAIPVAQATRENFHNVARL